jgi:regulator of protease activity HflC (stomatin/prohibitin superfamily)
LFTIVILWKTFLVVEQHQTVIRERLGKPKGTLRPGFHFMVPFIDRAAYKQEMREQVLDVPPQSCITKDNIQVEVDGMVYLKVVDPYKASYGIGNYRLAAVNLAQTTMRSEIGKLDLDDTFTERDKINESIVREIDHASDPWGVKVTRYEIMNIAPSRGVIETMEQQMSAERQKRADVTMSNGKKEAQITISEGQRQYDINISEGEMQQRINEAEGRADAIRVVADATAEGVKLVSEALRQPGGSAALKVRLVEQYLQELDKIIATSDVSVLPMEVAQLQAAVDGLSQVASHGRKTR